MRSIKVLHIVRDNKFFDGVYRTFEADDRFINKAVLITKSAQYVPSQIEQKEKVAVLSRRDDIKKLLISDGYDVLFFHSLNPALWFLFDYIPDNKVVIWWSWGADLYNSFYGAPPFIQLNLYKPLTSQFLKRRRGVGCIVKTVYNFFRYRFRYKSLREKVIRRIDYFEPVVGKEYIMLKELPGFRAKEFYHHNSIREVPINAKICRGDPQKILVGNSSTASNNHLDILESLNGIHPKGAKLIVPMSYGDAEYGRMVRDSVKEQSNIQFVLDFLPREQYFQIVEECGNALFGVIRQQAQGSINYALQQGKNVFLFRDSVMYQDFVDRGFSVHSIEEMNETSLDTPTTEETWERNCMLFRKESERRERIFENAIGELQEMLEAVVSHLPERR